MIGKESVKYSLKNLNQRKSRSMLTIFSIFIGITTIFIFVSFGYGLYDYVNSFATGSSADKIIIQAKGIGIPGLDDAFKLTDDDLKAVEKTPGVYEVTGAYIKVAKVSYRDEQKFVFLSAYDPKKPLILDISDIEIINGRNLKPGDKNKAVLGYNYQIPDKIFSKPIKVNDKIEINDEKIRVVGFFNAVGNPQDDSNIYITNDYIDELYKENNSYGWIIARVDTTNIDRVVENIEKNLRKERNLKEGEEDFFVQSFDDLLGAYSDALNLVVAFVILIALISVLVSTINTIDAEE